MPIVRATAILNKRSGAPRDAARNVWHFSTVGLTTGELNAIGNALLGFYADVATILSPAVMPTTAGGWRVEMAEVDYNGPGEADDVVSTILGTVSATSPGYNGGGGIPSEVAIALSFRGDVTNVPENGPGLTRPRSSRRGRVFLGPISASALEAPAPTYEPQVTLAARELILDAYDEMHDALGGTAADPVHGVYSRKDGILYPTQRVSVDNEPDTVRRRGRKPGIRMERSVPLTGLVGARSGADVVLAS